jgi:hypothetical protein
MNVVIKQIGTAAVAETHAMEFMQIPVTLWVRPAAGNTLTVEYSTDNGINFQAVTALTGAAAYAETVVNSGFTHLKITPSGVQGGSWGYA